MGAVVTCSVSFFRRFGLLILGFGIRALAFENRQTENNYPKLDTLKTHMHPRMIDTKAETTIWVSFILKINDLLFPSLVCFSC